MKVATYKKKNTSTWPEALIKYPKKYTRLWMHDCEFGAVPESIGDMENLTDVIMFQAQVTSIPSSFGLLTKVVKLHLYDNLLTSLPEEIGELVNCQEMHLARNCLTCIPESIGNCSALKELNLDGNQLATLPNSIGNLSKLQKLQLTSNKLSSLPESFGKLSSLEKVILNNNALKELPSTMGELQRLRTVHCSSNELESLPWGLSELKSLIMLRVTKNSFKTRIELPLCSSFQTDEGYAALPLAPKPSRDEVQRLLAGEEEEVESSTPTRGNSSSLFGIFDSFRCSAASDTEGLVLNVVSDEEAFTEESFTAQRKKIIELESANKRLEIRAMAAEDENKKLRAELERLRNGKGVERRDSKSYTKLIGSVFGFKDKANSKVADKAGETETTLP